MNLTNVHLDFHTSGIIEDVGEAFSQEDFIQKLTTAKVDAITCFAKCHHGYLYYDTALPERHPHLAKPLLNLQYIATKKAGIEMPVYISVGFDELQAALHPEWIALKEDGSYLKEFGSTPFDSGWYWLCLNNEYPNKIIEVIDDVIDNIGEVTGFFFDIVTQPSCCCTYCRKKMLAMNLQPHLAKDRETFATQVEHNFKRKVFNHIKQKLPNASVFYNGIVWNKVVADKTYSNYTQLEIESLPSGVWGYEHYPLVVKSLRKQSLPTVAMSARFHKSWADFGGYKNIEALEYETIRGAILSGAVSIGDQMHPRGFLDKEAYKNITQVFNKAKPLMELFSTLKPYSEIAIIADNRNQVTDIFSDSISGAASILQSEQRQFDIIEKQYFVFEQLKQYQLLIFPDNISLTEEENNILNAYCSLGGKALFTYKSGQLTEQDFSSLLPISTFSSSEYEQDYFEKNGTKYIAYQSALLINPVAHAAVSNPIFYPYFNRNYQHFSSHFQTPDNIQSPYFSKIELDNISYFAHPLFALYKENGNKIYEQLIHEVLATQVNTLFSFEEFNPFLQFEVFQEKENIYYVALFYYPQRRIGTNTIIDSIQKIYNVQFVVHQSKTIKRIKKCTAQTSQDIVVEQQQITVKEIIGFEVLKIELQ